MTRVRFIQPDGTEEELDVAEGWTVMQAAVAAGVPGIEGECGGSCACGTCHVLVEEADLPRLPGPTEAEQATLATIEEGRAPSSRLCCQIKAVRELEALTVRLPA